MVSGAGTAIGCAVGTGAVPAAALDFRGVPAVAVAVAIAAGGAVRDGGRD